ncbi:hypothetical protein GUITHDRAFT_97578 [Guillardia theta CCMP2712]|uniref:Cytochrome b5 heme-binding domain-containing protein n=1 Tax=Guillardia theta (strain CCMP2712) TaxID=905079 RepID=L1IKH1_GUITC|nr:hypothetical protein GUITHDRAFT_97578 [Guillardia theta CCMP2712]EKX36419.1 hypothetical protein GUITHDRAFT_97578 [Guillardia theta CCMP2712]|mmetsp:Transcript_45868/g.143907  ORF Transcript_45868/g.143907 Transcript_45868/m.143907 type:complete len:473 (-) Transcript_45868:185-1603(-)|eukprot:XP_005823399.1 hypothetical protein GUITHDRAFT_97578 [Guillardia theta CCMP2712]
MPPCAKGEAATQGIKTKPIITLEQLKAHDKKGDVWVAIEGKVYDVSKWAAHHPGGEHLLENMAGQDATAVFLAFHTEHGSGGQARKILQFLPHVADVYLPPETKLQIAFRKLRDQVDSDGLYKTSVSFYVCLGIWIAFLFSAMLYLTLTAHNIAQAIFAGAVFALFLQQCAFVGHDTSHNGITHRRFTDSVIGWIIGPSVTGISTAWWKRSHNAHHVVTNSTTHDPDIQHMPAFAITEDLFKKGGTWSYYHKRLFHFDSLAKFLISYQHFFYYPIMSFARLNLYLQSWLLVLNFDVKMEYRTVEIACLMIYWTWLSLLISCMPSVQLRLAFFFTSHMLAGILHVQITISHFSMPTYTGASFPAHPGEEFLRQQLYTSMDLESYWWNNWFYGGLQWQVAHHLFPRLPRHNLPEVKKRLQVLCQEHGLEYKSVGWWKGNAEILYSLRKAAMKARSTKVISFQESLLWAGMNAEG